MSAQITIITADWNSEFTSAHCTCGYMSNWAKGDKTAKMAAAHERKHEREANLAQQFPNDAPATTAPRSTALADAIVNTFSPEPVRYDVNAQPGTPGNPSTGGTISVVVATYLADGEPISATDDDEAFAVVENIAADLGRAVEITKNGQPLGTVLPDRGF